MRVQVEVLRATMGILVGRLEQENPYIKIYI